MEPEDKGGKGEREKQMKWVGALDVMVSIVFSGKFRWTMERVDLALMNVYYISAQATLGFEVTSFRVLRDSSCLPVRSALVLFRVSTQTYSDLADSSKC